MLLMVPWLLIKGASVAPIAFTLVVNALYWYAMRSELKQYVRLRRAGHLADRTQLFAFMGMNRMDKLTSSWLDRYRSWRADKSQPQD
jgi:hypothetical protein